MQGTNEIIYKIIIYALFMNPKKGQHLNVNEK